MLSAPSGMLIAERAGAGFTCTSQPTLIRNLSDTPRLSRLSFQVASVGDSCWNLICLTNTSAGFGFGAVLGAFCRAVPALLYLMASELSQSRQASNQL